MTALVTMLQHTNNTIKSSCIIKLLLPLDNGTNETCALCQMLFTHQMLFMTAFIK